MIIADDARRFPLQIRCRIFLALDTYDDRDWHCWALGSRLVLRFFDIVVLSRLGFVPIVASGCVACCYRVCLTSGQANEAIEHLKEKVDTLIVIANDKLLKVRRD